MHRVFILCVIVFVGPFPSFFVYTLVRSPIYPVKANNGDALPIAKSIVQKSILVDIYYFNCLKKWFFKENYHNKLEICGLYMYSGSSFTTSSNAQ